MVVVPGTEGNFGVLPGHAPLISTIRPGTIDIYEGNAIAERIFVVGGLAEVTPERCTVLADEAMPPEDARPRPARSRIADDRRQHADRCATQIGRVAGTDRRAPARPSCGQLERQFAVTSAKLRVLREIGG